MKYGETFYGRQTALKTSSSEFEGIYKGCPWNLRTHKRTKIPKKTKIYRRFYTSIITSELHCQNNPEGPRRGLED